MEVGLSVTFTLYRNATSVTMKPVTTRLPEDDEEQLSALEDELGADRAEVLRRLIRRGLTEWRKEKALDRLEDHEITLRQAAEVAGVSYVEMLTLAGEAGLDIGYTVDDLEQDLERL